jgi:hypothetical protein
MRVLLGRGRELGYLERRQGRQLRRRSVLLVEPGPWTNGQSFAQIAELAAEVRSSRNPDGNEKKFFAPLAPGYDKVLGGGASCVPRQGGKTMQASFVGNAASNPDGWMVISWNEITEGTYIMPLGRYGQQSLNTFRAITDGRSPAGPK